MQTVVYPSDVAVPPPAAAVEITLDQQGLTFERLEQLIAMLNRGAAVTVHNPARARTSTLELGFRLMSWYERVKNSV
jgi:hypothetical protein